MIGLIEKFFLAMLCAGAVCFVITLAARAIEHCGNKHPSHDRGANIANTAGGEVIGHRECE